MTVLYKRILLKLSGEGLSSPEKTIDPTVLEKISIEVKSILEHGVQVCLVLGAGNIFRGIAGAAGGMDRTTADYMGMLATIINGLALQDALRRNGIQAHVQSAVPTPTVCEEVIRDNALKYLQKGQVVIFVAGTGNPYFTTDTAAVLRALEMNCSAVLKSTSVDGVFDKDPKKNPDAVFLPTLTYTEFLEKKLRVMDSTAVALAQDSKLPLIVFNQTNKGLLKEIIYGKGKFSLIS